MRAVSQRTVGTILCILSACSYGATGIFGKLAFDEGLTVTGLLAARFSIAAIVLWLLVAALGRGSRPSRRGAAAGIAFGVVAYSAQTGLFFLALTRLDAGLAVLLVYIAPVLVAIAAVAFGREQLSRAQVVAVVVAVCGTALVATGDGVGKVDGLGMAFAFGCAVAFTAYMLLSHAVVGRVNPVALSASVCTGCALSFHDRGRDQRRPADSDDRPRVAPDRRARDLFDGDRDHHARGGHRARRAVVGDDPLDVRTGRRDDPGGDAARRAPGRAADRRRGARRRVSGDRQRPEKDPAAPPVTRRTCRRHGSLPTR